jgi:kynurenine formamidase
MNEEPAASDPDEQTPPSKWGPADELGAANLLPDVLTPEARAVIGNGRIFDLSQPISVDSPRLPMLMSAYSMCMWSNPISSRHFLEETNGIENAIGYADERVEFDLHTGTHIDALGHTFANDRTYNGFTVRETVTNWGLKRLGIENLPPVVARGVLIDLPTLKGRDLEPGEVVTVTDLRRALSGQEIELDQGDVVLIRTGWARYYSEPETYVAAWPGIGLDAARWLVARNVSVVGADTMGLEVYPDEVATVHAPVHQYLLARSGVYILEQANLDPLADAGVYSFLCLCLAPRFVGGTAAPVRLVALG